MALFVFWKCLVHAMIGGRGFLGFVLIAIAKMDILYMFYQFQDPIKVIRRYEGCYYTRLESYYIIFYFETDWSRIRPLPSSTLTAQPCLHAFRVLTFLHLSFLFKMFLFHSFCRFQKYWCKL